MKRYATLGSVTGPHLGIGFDTSNWVIGFGWIHSCIHFNLGPVVIVLHFGVQDR